jgi:hypothetical protein
VDVELVPALQRVVLPRTSTRSTASGQFRFGDVPEGRYTLVVRPRPGETPRWGAADIIVSANRTTPATIGLRDQPRMSGTVELAGVRGVSLRLTALDRNEAAASSQMQRVLASGPFEIAPVPPGSYQFAAVIGQGDPLPAMRAQWREHPLLPSITLDGEEITDRVFVVEPDTSIANLQVVVRDPAARISGAVRDASNAPATAGAVVVLSADPDEWTPVSRRQRVVRADTDGVYDVTGLPAGRYHVVHVPRLGAGQIFDLGFLQTLTKAPVVDVTTGAHVTVDLRAADERRN